MSSGSLKRVKVCVTEQIPYTSTIPYISRTKRGNAMANKAKKFLVISYDPDEQQWFYDTVRAINADMAKAIVLKWRDYAIDADAIELRELRQIVDRIAKKTPTQVRKDLQTLRKDFEEIHGKVTHG